MKTQWIAFAIFVCVLTYQETDGRKHDTKRHQRKFAKATKFSDLAKLNEDLEASRLKDKRAENETDGEKVMLGDVTCLETKRYLRLYFENC